MIAKPSVFIGSSSEGLDFARAVRNLLNKDAEIAMWNEGFFGPSKTFIDTLVNESQRFDFAILVLTPDDLVQSQGIETFGPRDNVIFELGLFMGRLGRERTFLLHQSSPSLKIPSDLAGVSTTTYDWPRDDKNERSAVGAACDDIRKSIREKGVSDRKTIKQISDLRSEVEGHGKEIKNQQEIIELIREALKKTLTKGELGHLINLSESPWYQTNNYQYCTFLENEMVRLCQHGYVEENFHAAIWKMREKGDSTFDLKDLFRITNEGRNFLKLLGELKPDVYA